MTYHGLELVFPAAMAYAGAMDLFTMTIPNRVSLILVAAFVVVALVAGLPSDIILTHFAVGGAMLIAGIGMFSRGWIGGGDAKLLAAAALWIGLPELLSFLLATGLIGTALLAVILLFRTYPAAALPIPEWALRLHRSKTGLPYGVAIGSAGMLIFPYSPVFQALTLGT